MRLSTHAAMVASPLAPSICRVQIGVETIPSYGREAYEFTAVLESYTGRLSSLTETRFAASTVGSRSQ